MSRRRHPDSFLQVSHTQSTYIQGRGCQMPSFVTLTLYTATPNRPLTSASASRERSIFGGPCTVITVCGRLVSKIRERTTNYRRLSRFFMYDIIIVLTRIKRFRPSYVASARSPRSVTMPLMGYVWAWNSLEKVCLDLPVRFFVILLLRFVRMWMCHEITASLEANAHRYLFAYNVLRVL